FGIYTSTLADKEVQKMEERMAPILAAYDDEITQNAELFARIKAVYDGRAKAKLAPDQLRLVETGDNNLPPKGAALDATAKARMKEINQRLASLYTKFSQNELADEEGHALTLTSEADLAGLPDPLRASARAAAEAKGEKGWLFSNTRSSMEPFLIYSTRRD